MVLFYSETEGALVTFSVHGPDIFNFYPYFHRPSLETSPFSPSVLAPFSFSCPALAVKERQPLPTSMLNFAYYGAKAGLLSPFTTIR